MIAGARRRRLTAAIVVLAAVTACNGGARSNSSPDPRDWPAVVAAARGQEVNWYMYGGDEALNRFISGYLSKRLERYGVTINQVRLADTADGINRILAEKQAGRRTGSVDLVWVNGENFATGQQAKLWHCGYDRSLPNARYVDFDDPAVSHDFGEPVAGCESVWQQAHSALVYDSAALTKSDVASVSSLFEWANRHPGRFTYPAPPDFTGSMAVRTFLYEMSGPAVAGSSATATELVLSSARLWERLGAVEADLWRGGDTYPSSQLEVERLYANGEIDAFLTYGPGAVGTKVAEGVFPASTRETVLSVGNIANSSFVAIPYNAPHRAAALVVANELLDPDTQLALFSGNGVYPAISLDTLTAAQRGAFEAVDLGPSVLSLGELTANTLAELPANHIARLESDWKTNVLQR